MFSHFTLGLKSAVRGGQIRRSLVVALLLAFVLQAQLAATHFHLIPNAGAPALAADVPDQGSKQQKKAPSQDNCPLCQQIAGTHSFVAPPLLEFRLPEPTADRVEPIRATAVVEAKLAFDWQSRAPPL